MIFFLEGNKDGGTESLRGSRGEDDRKDGHAGPWLFPPPPQSQLSIKQGVEMQSAEKEGGRVKSI